MAGLIKYERITVAVTKSVKARLQRESEDRDRSLGKMAGIVIKEYFEQKDAPPPVRPAPALLPPVPAPVIAMPPVAAPVSLPPWNPNSGMLPPMLPEGIEALEA